MRAYGDTSWWLAYKCRRDVHHARAIPLFNENPDLYVVWTPWQRVEAFNGLRQAERTGTIERGESNQIIHLLEREVRLGYWLHVEFEWTEAVRTANDLSFEHSTRMPIRGMDLFHVAIALEIGADILLAFDKELNDLAIAAGLNVIS